MTVSEVATAFDVDVARVLAGPGALNNVDPGLSIKAVAGTYGDSVDDLKTWLESLPGGSE